jgi:hypothetical protein
MTHELTASGNERRSRCHGPRWQDPESHLVGYVRRRGRGGDGRNEAAKSLSPANQDEIREGFVGWKEAAVPSCDAAGIVNELRKASPDASGYRAHRKPML